MLNALKSLKRMKVMAFLIIIQFTIGLIMLNSSAVSIEATRHRMDCFSRLFNFQKTYLVRPVFDGDNLPSNYESEKVMDDFYNYLQLKQSENKIINTSIYFTNPTFFQEIRKMAPEKYQKLPGMESSYYVTSLMVDYNFIEYFDLKISSGRTFEENDFNINYKRDNIPIILGNDYADEVSIGDTFIESEFGESEMVFEVVGFYGNNSIPSILDKLELLKNVRFSNSFIIYPTVPGAAYFNENVAINDLGCFVETNSIDEVNKIKEEFDAENKDNGYSLRIVSLRDDYYSAKEVLYKEVINSVVLGIVLTLLSVVGVVCVFIGEMKDRQKEFGIRLASGARIKDISKELISEVFIMMCGASIMSIASLGMKKVLLVSVEQVLTLNLVIYNLGFIFILTLFIAMIPIKKLRGLTPVDLMRGDK